MDILALRLAPLIALLSGALLLAGGRRGQRAAAPLAIAVAALTAGLLAALCIARPAAAWAWPMAQGPLHLSLAAAGVAAPLALTVALIALPVFVYAAGFLEAGDSRPRFFGLMCGFLGAMVWLILANDLLTLLLGWELVGACSYALIGFWYQDPDRVRAANRAFLVTRTADLGLYIACMAAFAQSASLALDGLAMLPEPARNLVTAGLVLAAAGKSAQLPFSGWLSGAMLGPSPVSALLHSATMVAAGAILLLKVLPLVAVVDWAPSLILWLGVASAAAGAIIALHHGELKQVLAASTVSQFGYMFAGIGALAVGASAGYLVNHAAFKAALFLGAGLFVARDIHRLQDMGGLGRRLPQVAAGLGAAALALAAMPPLGGFFAKEALLAEVKTDHRVGAWLLLAVAVLTAAYATRFWLAAFAGAPLSRMAAGMKQQPAGLRMPILLLAAAALVLGAIFLPPLEARWTHALGVGSLPAFSWTEASLSLAAALLGAGWMLWLFRRGRLLAVSGFARRAPGWFGAVRLLDGSGHAVLGLANGLDRIERAQPALAIAQATRRAARALRFLDATRPEQRFAGAVQSGARAAFFSDRRLIDGGIQGLVAGLGVGARGLSRAQNGLLHGYYARLAIGAAALLICAWFTTGA